MTDYRTKAERDTAERFPRDAGRHAMTVLHDDGLYRHLRFARPKPESSMYWFDLITWPGCLTIRGDLGESYTFNRLPDMFEFFRSRSGRINAHYWAEKLDGHRDSAREYDEDRFAETVWTYVRESGHGYRGLAKAVQREIFDNGYCCDETSAREAMESFEHDGFRFKDTWELSFHDHKWTFLWACHAIVWGIARYDKVARYGLKALATIGVLQGLTLGTSQAGEATAGGQFGGDDWVSCSHRACPRGEYRAKAAERGWHQGPMDAWLCTEHAGGGQ